MRDDSPKKNRDISVGSGGGVNCPLGVISDGGIMLNPLNPQLNFQFFMVDSWG